MSKTYTTHSIVVCGTDGEPIGLIPLGPNFLEVLRQFRALDQASFQLMLSTLGQAAEAWAKSRRDGGSVMNALIAHEMNLSASEKSQPDLPTISTQE